MADALFEDPRLAVLYDPLDPDRRDLDAYVAMVTEFEVSSLLDVGCGTGTFACLLAQRGLDVVGLDPAAASLAVARQKPGADRVRWIQGDVGQLPALSVDMVTMTGNVAQVFLGDKEWLTVLGRAREALRSNGRLVFEVRDPSRLAWQSWTRSASTVSAVVPGVGTVEAWSEVSTVNGQLVSFTSTFRIADETLTSRSTLRFRTREEIATSLELADLRLLDVRDAPDRPGLEFVFVAQRQDWEVSSVPAWRPPAPLR